MTKNADEEMTTMTLRVTRGQKRRWGQKARAVAMTLTQFTRLAMDRANVTVSVSVDPIQLRQDEPRRGGSTRRR